ncbi:hypothetical protein B0H65DRAFT_169706 [Neurospora tetraspora]|uniref:Uncharacterized protein n=1 Tax=Neurospora tetraspora TaxID=94610 RepID=A0AAE0JI61_9PEZI|nr:hypothetical protein B0H65DRAFT_169706 [Neurospora tetraspora]
MVKRFLLSFIIVIIIQMCPTMCHLLSHGSSIPKATITPSILSIISQVQLLHIRKILCPDHSNPMIFQADFFPTLAATS